MPSGAPKADFGEDETVQSQSLDELEQATSGTETKGFTSDDAGMSRRDQGGEGPGARGEGGGRRGEGGGRGPGGGMGGMDPAAMEKLRNASPEERKRLMEEAMKNMSPEMRERMEAARKARDGGGGEQP